MLPIELRNFVADSSRFSQALGWQAHVPLEQGIDLTIDYFLRQDRME
jgi:nucleoside-diphosphate-sugar epimerase